MPVLSPTEKRFEFEIFITSSDAERDFGFKASSLRCFASRGWIPFVKIDKVRMYDITHLQLLSESYKENGTLDWNGFYEGLKETLEFHKVKAPLVPKGKGSYARKPKLDWDKGDTAFVLDVFRECPELTVQQVVLSVIKIRKPKADLSDVLAKVKKLKEKLNA